MAGVRRVPAERTKPKESSFSPSASFSFGYGYPNLDKNQLYQSDGYYQGTVKDNGVIYGSFDYKISPKSSIGIMAAHGKVSVPYYGYNSSSAAPALNGSLENWNVMLNIIRYMPGSIKVSPYLRTAIGINLWTQDYTDGSGSKIQFPNPTSLAYQASLGVKFHLGSNTSFSVEGGYGKYIVSGGLSFKL